MSDDTQSGGDPLGYLPDDVVAQIRDRVGDEGVCEAAPTDLDDHGMYVEGYLVLAEDQLGSFQRSADGWNVQWWPVEPWTGLSVFDGLGMQVLRLMQDSAVAVEFRYTLRYAREMAKLHRHLERMIEGDTAGDPPPAEPVGEEKKIRCETCGRVIPAWTDICPACLCRRKVLSRLFDFVMPYKWRALAGFLLALLIMLVTLARPYLTKPMLNEGLGLEEGYDADYRTLMTFVLAMVGLTVVAAVGGALQRRLMLIIGSRIAMDVRDRTYSHLHTLSLSFFSRRPTGSLVTRITSDSERIWDFLSFTIIEMVVAIGTIVGVGVALFVMNWKLACFVLIPVPVMTVLMIVVHKKMHRFFHRIFHRWSQMTAVVADAIPGVRVIKAFSQEDREVGRFADKNLRVFEGQQSLINLWTIFGPALQMCSQIGSLIVWGLGGYWAVTGEITPGTLMAFIAYMWMFYEPIHMLSHMDRNLNRAATSVQRIFEVLDTEPAIFSRAEARSSDNLTGNIELQNVTFSYDGVRRVLRDVSLSIAPGEMIGLAGPSGAGKSTLINLVCRFYDPQEGRILIDGHPLRDLDVEAFRRRVGVVLQEPFLFHGTVADNIAYGYPDVTPDRLIEAAKAANAHDFIVGFPDGYDTLVGERGHTLSGGERQRISIARAIVNNPTILILDEATSSVDTQTEKLIQEALDRLIANRTTIAIAHRLSTLRKADRLVILDEGKIVERGSHEELMGLKDGVYANLLRMQGEMQSLIAVEG